MRQTHSCYLQAIILFAGFAIPILTGANILSTSIYITEEYGLSKLRNRSGIFDCLGSAFNGDRVHAIDPKNLLPMKTCILDLVHLAERFSEGK